jgi:hypothetical protein
MYKLTEKISKVLPPEIIVLLERPDVVELVRYFNGRLISYKVANEQGRIEDQSKGES